MALRWVRTIGESPHMFSTRENADSDWLLYCGGWQVGRVHENLRPAGRVVFVWSLNGPHMPPAVAALRSGEASTVAQAKQQLVDAMRAWAMWAGVRTSVGGGPAAPRWVLTRDGRPDSALDAANDWLMFSGDFLVGRAYRPASGPRRDPHWMLYTSGPMQMPGSSAGWADSIDAAKADLLHAWQAWLEWAELA